MDTINDLKFIDYLRTILRYLASGVVGLFTLLWINGFNEEKLYLIAKSGWSYLLIVFIIGIFTYAFHKGVMDNFFYRKSLRKLYDSTENPCFKKYLQNIGLDRNTPLAKKNDIDWRFVFNMYSYRYKRDGLEVLEMKSIQLHLNDYYNLMVFTFSCAYLLIGIAILEWFKMLWVQKNNICDLIYDVPVCFIPAIILGCFSLKIAMSLDIKVTKRELWVINTYQLNTAVNTKYAKNGVQELLSWLKTIF